MIPYNADFPQAFIDDTIHALLAQPGAKQRGAQITCCSPFRDERKPSFSFSTAPDKLCGKDFKTGQGYGIIETAQALGIELARYQDGAPALHIVRKPSPPPAPVEAAPPAADWQQAAQDALRAAQDALADTPGMLDYLRHERLLTDETIAAAGLGYNPRWRDLPGGGKLAPGLVLPYQQAGSLWALRVRTFDTKLSKYINASGSKVSGTLYGARALAAGKPVLMVEGEFDCLLAQQDAGDTLAVVTLGPASNRLSPHWRAALMSAPVIYLALDNDSAGQQAAAALGEALAGADVRLLRYPDGIKDYTDYRKAGGQLDALLAPGRAWWPAGMPDTWRAQIRRWYGPAAELAADIINRAVCAGMIDPDKWTVSQVAAATAQLGINASRDTLQRGITELLACDLSAELGIEDTGLNTMPNSADKSVTNSKPAHRPAKHYRCKPLSGAITRLLALSAPAIYQQHHPVEGETATAAQWTGDTLAALDISPEAAQDVNAALAAVWNAQGGTRHAWAAERAAGALAELRRKLTSDTTITRPADGINSAGTVGRAAAHLRAQVEAGAPARSYAALAADLGISRQSVPAVLRRAGIIQVEQTAARAVTQADDLPRQAKVFAGAVRGKVLNILIETGAGQVEKISYAGAASIETVREHLAAGHTVKLEARCASAQQLGALPAAAPKVARAPRTAPRRAAQDGQRRQDAPKPAPKRSPAPGYNPAWILGQLMLQARLAGLLRGGQVIDRATGELVPIAGAPGWRLLESITGLKLHNSTTYHLPAPAGWRKVDIQTGGRNERQIAG